MKNNGFRPHFASPEAASAKPELGNLPEWNLTHLYPAIESDRFSTDMEKAGTESKSFSEQYKGKLADLATITDAKVTLGASVKRY